ISTSCLAGYPCAPTEIAMLASLLAAACASVEASDELDTDIWRNASTTMGSNIMRPNDTVISSSKLDCPFLLFGSCLIHIGSILVHSLLEYIDSPYRQIFLLVAPDLF